MGGKKKEGRISVAKQEPEPDNDSDPDPDPVGSAFNLGLNPGSGSIFGIWIQMSKNRFKKPKFTTTDFKDENRNMLR
jgi:hypothetical protein